MSECVVRMEMPKEGCHTCDARCVSALYGYICGIERKNVMPFLGKKNRPDWCPIICQLPEGHGDLVDKNVLMKLMLERKQPLVGADSSKDRYRYMQWLADFNAIRDAKTIVPAERSETEQV